MKKLAIVILAIIMLLAAVMPVAAGGGPRRITAPAGSVRVAPNPVGQYIYTFTGENFGQALVASKGHTYRIPLFGGSPSKNFRVRWHAWENSGGCGYAIVVIPNCKGCVSAVFARPK